MGKWIKVDYTLKEIPDSRIDDNIWMKNSKWAEMNQEDFIARLKKFKKSSSIPQEWSKKLGSKIRKEYSEEYLQNIYSEFLRKHFPC